MTKEKNMAEKPEYVIVHCRADGSVEVDGFPVDDLVFMQKRAAELGEFYRVAELRFVDEEAR